MSKRRQPSPAPTVDLRAAARAFLAGEDHAPLAILSSALRSIRAIAEAAEPVIVTDADHQAALRGRSSGHVRGGVAVIPLQGVITPQGSWLDRLFGGGAGGLQGFRSSLREALGDDDVAAIVLDVHSPGGSVSLVPETAAEIRAARDEKPIVAVANTMSASAAYWLAAQADEVVVTPSGFLGSIGVYMVHDDWSGFNEALGVLPTYVYAGTYKVEGNPDEPLSDEAKAAIQAEVDDLYGLFVADVAAGRGVSADAVRSGYGEGRVLPAARAVTAGLGDRVATIDDVVRELAAGGGASDRRRRAQAPAPAPAALPPAPPAPAPVPVPAEVTARLAELATLPAPAAL